MICVIKIILLFLLTSHVYSYNEDDIKNELYDEENDLEGK